MRRWLSAVGRRLAKPDGRRRVRLWRRARQRPSAPARDRLAWLRLLASLAGLLTLPDIGRLALPDLRRRFRMPQLVRPDLARWFRTPRLRLPGREFREAARGLAPDVAIRVIHPGEGLTIPR